MNKSINERQQSLSSKFSVSEPEKVETKGKVLWEKPYINSSQVIHTESGDFHYEMVIRGEEITKKNSHKSYRAVCICKVCVKSFRFGGQEYQFFINPVDSISTCRVIPEIIVKWKKGVLEEPVFSKVELNSDRLFEKYKSRIEVFLEHTFSDEILTTFLNQHRSGD